MSEPGPSSIPTSADPRSHRPTKRRAVSPHSEQASVINSLFRDPSKEIKLPTASTQKTASSLPAPPEIVANVQGSSAGAGSGEFHVYKASRRREYERLRLMQEEVDREKEGAEWQRKQEEVRRKDQEKTEKNRRRREKRNKAKAKGAKKDASAAVAGADAGGAAEGGKGSDEMDVTEKGVKTNKTGEEDQTEAAVETPGVIIHDDE
ncbi:PRKRIP1 family protein [Aspergillus foveolatus]|uniref:PRKRIP1 family protein n=1 Tax=Aspergillus foveolatus TaxID=210207 RepID=UPI003CCDC764